MYFYCRISHWTIYVCVRRSTRTIAHLSKLCCGYNGASLLDIDNFQYLLHFILLIQVYLAMGCKVDSNQANNYASNGIVQVIVSVLKRPHL